MLVTGKRIKRGAGWGLKIPVKYVFHGNEKALQWAKKILDNIYVNINKKVGRSLKKNFNVLSQTCGIYFVFLACLLLGGNFHQECPIGTIYLRPLMGGVRY